MRTAGKIFPAADMIAAAVCGIFQPDVDDICDAVHISRRINIPVLSHI